MTAARTIGSHCFLQPTTWIPPCISQDNTPTPIINHTPRIVFIEERIGIGSKSTIPSPPTHLQLHSTLLLAMLLLTSSGSVATLKQLYIIAQPRKVELFLVVEEEVVAVVENNSIQLKAVYIYYIKFYNF